MTRADRSANKVLVRVVCTGAGTPAPADSAAAQPSGSAAPAARPARPRAPRAPRRRRGAGLGARVQRRKRLRRHPQSCAPRRPRPGGPPRPRRRHRRRRRGAWWPPAARWRSPSSVTPLAPTWRRVARSGGAGADGARARRPNPPAAFRSRARRGPRQLRGADRRRPAGLTPEVRRAVAAWVEGAAWCCSRSGRARRGRAVGATFEPSWPGRSLGQVAVAGHRPGHGGGALGAAAPSYADLAAKGRASLDAGASDAAEVLARWQDGAPFLLRRPMGRGSVLVLTLPFDPEQSDLALRPAFPGHRRSLRRPRRAARGGARRIDAGQSWTFDGFQGVRVRRLGGPAPTRRSRCSTPTGAAARGAAAGGLLYEIDLGDEKVTRVAAVPEREIDFRPRPFRPRRLPRSSGGGPSMASRRGWRSGCWRCWRWNGAARAAGSAPVPRRWWSAPRESAPGWLCAAMLVVACDPDRGAGAPDAAPPGEGGSSRATRSPRRRSRAMPPPTRAQSTPQRRTTAARSTAAPAAPSPCSPAAT